MEIKLGNSKGKIKNHVHNLEMFHVFRIVQILETFNHVHNLKILYSIFIDILCELRFPMEKKPRKY